MALAEVPTGAIADRFGRKVSLAMGALLYSVAMFAFTARVMSPVFLVGYLLWTTSNTLFSGADPAVDQPIPIIMAVGDRPGIPRAFGVAGLLLTLMVLPVGLLW